MSDGQEREALEAVVSRVLKDAGIPEGRKSPEARAVREGWNSAMSYRAAFTAREEPDKICICGHRLGYHGLGTKKCYRCDCEKFATREEPSTAERERHYALAVREDTERPDGVGLIGAEREHAIDEACRATFGDHKPSDGELKSMRTAISAFEAALTVREEPTELELRLAEECDERGLPVDLGGLLRHVANNAKLAGTFDGLAAREEPQRGLLKIVGDEIHEWARGQGFYDREYLPQEEDTFALPKLNPCGPAEKLCLIHSEVSEILSALRDGDLAHEAEECADVLIRLLDYATWRKIDLDAEVEAKMVKNRARPRLHGRKF